jgi:hypothetical protein
MALLNNSFPQNVGKGSNVKNIAKQYIQVKLSFINWLACLIDGSTGQTGNSPERLPLDGRVLMDN